MGAPPERERAVMAAASRRIPPPIRAVSPRRPQRPPRSATAATTGCRRAETVPEAAMTMPTPVFVNPAERRKTLAKPIMVAKPIQKKQWIRA